jgi:hypothetical protein
MKLKRSTIPIPDFQHGQVWRMGQDRLQIGVVGRWLVHYRHYKGMSKRPPAQFTEKGELWKLLADRKAILVPNQAGFSFIRARE